MTWDDDLPPGSVLADQHRVMAARMQALGFKPREADRIVEILRSTDQRADYLIGRRLEHLKDCEAGRHEDFGDGCMHCGGAIVSACAHEFEPAAGLAGHKCFKCGNFVPDSAMAATGKSAAELFKRRFDADRPR